MSLTYDAPAGQNFITPIRLTVNPREQFPFRQDLSAVIYLDDFVQRPDYFEPLPLDTPHPEKTNAYLISETNPKAMSSSGLFKWTRVFATVPATRTEFQSTNFSFPAYRASSESTTTLRSSFTETCVARVVYSYLMTANPEADLSFTPMFQPLDSAGVKCDYVASDTTPTKADYEAKVSAGDYIQATQTKVRRWRGNIWELQNIQVKAL